MQVRMCIQVKLRPCGVCPVPECLNLPLPPSSKYRLRRYLNHTLQPPRHFRHYFWLPQLPLILVYFILPPSDAVKSTLFAVLHVTKKKHENGDFTGEVQNKSSNSSVWVAVHVSLAVSTSIAVLTLMEMSITFSPGLICQLFVCLLYFFPKQPFMFCCNMFKATISGSLILLCSNF